MLKHHREGRAHAVIPFGQTDVDFAYVRSTTTVSSVASNAMAKRRRTLTCQGSAELASAHAMTLVRTGGAALHGVELGKTQCFDQGQMCSIDRVLVT